MITQAAGNLLEARTEALVNTVNTVGVMGKGIALQFKRAFPENFKRYRAACERGDVSLGRMFITSTGQMEPPQYIINFPTKGHWKSRSRLADVRVGLQDLVRVVAELQVKSIAVPPLGCGNGGLDWREVEPLIRTAFEELSEVDVQLFPPTGAPNAAEMPVATKRPNISTGRAALLALLDRYRVRANQEQMTDALGVSELELQKLLYFLQLAGQPLRLKFSAGRYGPYADMVSHQLDAMEGHYTVGFGDRSARVLELKPIVPIDGAVEAAEQFVTRHGSDLNKRIARVIELVDGFASPYGLELLSTVHWVSGKAANAKEAADLVYEWSPRKGRLFTPEHVVRAWKQLDRKGWLPER